MFVRVYKICFWSYKIVLNKIHNTITFWNSISNMAVPEYLGNKPNVLLLCTYQLLLLLVLAIFRSPEILLSKIFHKFRYFQSISGFIKNIPVYYSIGNIPSLISICLITSVWFFIFKTLIINSREICML